MDYQPVTQLNPPLPCSNTGRLEQDPGIAWNADCLLVTESPQINMEPHSKRNYSCGGIRLVVLIYEGNYLVQWNPNHHA